MNLDIEDFTIFISVKKGLKGNSIRLVRERVCLFLEWLQRNDLPLAPTSLERFFFELQERGYKNNTLNTYVFALRYFRDYQKERGFDASFFEGIQSFDKNDTYIEILTPEQIERLLNTPLTYGVFRGKNVTEYQDFSRRTLTMFLAYTGCRYMEAVSLKVKDVNLDQGKALFRDTKNSKMHTVYFTNPLASRLKKMINGKGIEDYIFVNTLGKRIHQQDFNDDLKRRAHEAGIPENVRIYPHLLRHCFATQLLVSGVPIETVANLLNHKDIQTTYSKYAHLADETLRKATFRHPLVRKSIRPRTIMDEIKEAIDNFKLWDDNRFIYKVEQGASSLQISIFIK